MEAGAVFVTRAISSSSYLSTRLPAIMYRDNTLVDLMFGCFILVIALHVLYDTVCTPLSVHAFANKPCTYCLSQGLDAVPLQWWHKI